ncbi:MAG: hypothetical protein CMK59_14750 [Proteobacteria bacterium]|nr:hypothetical protein [Pseudomonadota bacterium]
MTILLLCSSIYAFSAYSYESLQNRLNETIKYRSLRLVDYTPTIPQSAYQKAAKGYVATGLDDTVGWGVAVFEVPINELWRGINHELHHTGLTPVSHTEIIKGTPCSDGRWVLMEMPIPLITDRWWITEQLTAPNLFLSSQGVVRELSWKEVKEKTPLNPSQKERYADMIQVPSTRGAWLLISLDNTHTLAEYHSKVDPGGYLPVGPSSNLAVFGLEQTFTAMEQYAQNPKPESCHMPTP